VASYTSVVPEWTDVPGEAWKRWSEIFEQSRDGLDVKGECPVCSQQELHRWFDASVRQPNRPNRSAPRPTFV
jgi:hypothetical protein